VALAQGVLPQFFEQAIVFNARHYAPYLPIELTNPVALLGALLSFAQYRFTFVVDWLAGQETKATMATFAVFLETLLLVGLAVLVARRPDERPFRLAVALLVPLAVAREGFHASPFIVLAGFACAQLLPSFGGQPVAVRAAAVAALVVALRMHLLFVTPGEGAREDLAASLRPEPRVLEHATPGDAVLFLPITPHGYLAHDRRPGSFYAFFLPWQADVPGAEDRVIADLERDRVAVVVLDQEAAVWGKHRLRDYAPRLHAHILATYSPVDSGDRRRARIFVRKAAAPEPSR
jgi:hypothetical protein